MELMELINRQAVLDIVEKYACNTQRIYDAVKALPPAQPEPSEISYKDCANAMLKMWIDKVLTDGEYNRIMDKLNAYWAERREE